MDLRVANGTRHHNEFVAVQGHGENSPPGSLLSVT